MTPLQCRMARAGLGLSARQLATHARVSLNTVFRFEQGQDVLNSTVQKMRAALESAGAEFSPDGRSVTIATRDAAE